MADDRFQLRIITPERVFYEGEASMIELTTTEGEIGVYKNHVPLTYIIAPGILFILASLKFYRKKLRFWQRQLNGPMRLMSIGLKRRK